MGRFVFVLCVVSVFFGCSGKSETSSSQLSIITTSLPDAYLNQPYGPEQIEARGGKQPYGFTEVGTNLSNFGFILNQDGTVESTNGPTTTGVCRFGVQVTDSSQPPRSAQATLSIAVYTPAGYQNPPTSPSDLQSLTIQPRSVTLKWRDNSNDEDEFILQRDTDQNFTSPVEFSVPPQGGANSFITYTDTTVSPATQYYYRVKARNKAGDSSFSNTVSVKTPREFLLWGGTENDSGVALFEVSGYFWLVGTTTSFNKTDGAVFFAKFDSGWNIQGSWVYSINGMEVSAVAAVESGGIVYLLGTVRDKNTNAADLLVLAFNTQTETILWDKTLDVLGDNEWPGTLLLSGSGDLWIVGTGVVGQIGGQNNDTDIFWVGVSATNGTVKGAFRIGGSILMGTVPTADLAGSAVATSGGLAISGTAVLVDLQTLNPIPTLLLLQFTPSKGTVTGYQVYEIPNGAVFPASMVTDGNSFYLAGLYSNDLQALYNWLQNPSGNPPSTKPFLAKLSSTSCEWAKYLDVSSATTAFLTSLRLSGAGLTMCGGATLSSGGNTALYISTSTSAVSFTAKCWGSNTTAVALDQSNRIIGSTTDYNASWQSTTATPVSLQTIIQSVSFSTQSLTVSAVSASGTLSQVNAQTTGAGNSDALVVW